MPNDTEQELYIVLISIHGLIRASELELGRDADTGGQTLYVVELAKALAAAPGVARVDLLTRLVDDPKVSDDYKQPETPLTDKARIVRLRCGPRRYLRKEVLWRHLDCFADNALRYIRSQHLTPDVVHTHYADAGYVGAHLAGLLDVPLLHTGHSLGRVKQQRLRDKGLSDEAIEKRYHISRRIEAEEQTLEAAAQVLASTHQEVQEQYELYDQYRPERMSVIAPGTDLERFFPAQPNDCEPSIQADVDRFLHTPDKPMILALSRPDERKNIGTLVDVFGQSPALREAANLVIIAGNRDDIDDLDNGAQRVLTHLLKRIDRHDLYGQVAYPKHHRPDDVPELYRLAARRRGIFVNPALTEPFGLTLIEAAACGLPILATNDGGPRDIIAHCQNGELIDPLDKTQIERKLLALLNHPKRWAQYAKAGESGARQHYAWPSHAKRYLGIVDMLGIKPHPAKSSAATRCLTQTDRVLISDIDDTLIGGQKTALKELLHALDKHRKMTGFGIATGRQINDALKVLKEWRVPLPDILITGVGSEIYYGPNLVPDLSWQAHINQHWDRAAIQALLRDLPGLRLQPSREQSAFKLSFDVNPAVMPALQDIRAKLRSADLHANLIYSCDRFLDVLPLRASKGQAVRYCADKWNVDLENVLVAGDSGNDLDMMSGRTLGVIVGNAIDDFTQLHGLQRVLFADGTHAAGILEAIAHYDFFGQCRPPHSNGSNGQALTEKVA